MAGADIGPILSSMIYSEIAPNQEKVTPNSGLLAFLVPNPVSGRTPSH